MLNKEKRRPLVESLRLSDRISSNGKYHKIAHRASCLLIAELPMEVYDLLCGILRQDSKFPSNYSFEEVWCLQPHAMLDILGVKKRIVPKGKNIEDNSLSFIDYFNVIRTDEKLFKRWVRKQLLDQEYRQGRKELTRKYAVEILKPKLENILLEYQNKALIRIGLKPGNSLNTIPFGSEIDQDTAIDKFKKRCVVLGLKKGKTIPLETLYEIVETIGMFSGTLDEFTTNCREYTLGREYASRLGYKSKRSGVNS